MNLKLKLAISHTTSVSAALPSKRISHVAATNQHQILLSAWAVEAAVFESLPLPPLSLLPLDGSSVARGGGGLEPPHWLVKYAKSHVFGGFEVDFW